tara:strand:- start:6605 stop:7750 length:1146 start_codon:yes stop_codon:yes gene_type:complete
MAELYTFILRKYEDEKISADYEEKKSNEEMFKWFEEGYSAMLNGKLSSDESKSDEDKNKKEIKKKPLADDNTYYISPRIVGELVIHDNYENMMNMLSKTLENLSTSNRRDFIGNTFVNSTDFGKFLKLTKLEKEYPKFFKVVKAEFPKEEKGFFLLKLLYMLSLLIINIADTKIEIENPQSDNSNKKISKINMIGYLLLNSDSNIGEGESGFERFKEFIEKYSVAEDFGKNKITLRQPNNQVELFAIFVKWYLYYYSDIKYRNQRKIQRIDEHPKQVQVSNMLNNIINEEAYPDLQYFYTDPPFTNKNITIPGKNKIRIEVKDIMSKYDKQTQMPKQTELDEIIDHIYGLSYFQAYTSQVATFEGRKVSFKNTNTSIRSMF